MTGPAPTTPAAATATPAGPPARASDEQIGALSGTFVDPALEREFRLASSPDWSSRVSVVATIASVLIPAFGYVDYQALGWGLPLAVMWSMRLSLLVVGLAIAAWLRRPRTPAQLDAAALTLMLAIAALIVLMVFIERKGIARESPAILLATISFYVFVPVRFGFQLGAALALTASFLWAQRAWGPPAPVEWASAAIQLLVCNALGIHAALRAHAAARREFLSVRRELRHKRDLQKSVAALEKSNAELEQFAYVASHDLQSPLRNVISFAQLLQRRCGESLGAKGGEYVATIIHSAGHMHSLITDLLTFSRVGRGNPALAPIDMEHLLAEVEHTLAARIREKGAQITHGPLPVIAGTPTEVRQLLQNLLENALTFQADGTPPQVHVAARSAQSSWEFSVRDNGIGIRPEHQGRIFQMFERLHDGEAFPGTGVGLAICRKIVLQHGGRIWVESEVGKGATFRFTLPLQAPAAA